MIFSVANVTSAVLFTCFAGNVKANVNGSKMCTLEADTINHPAICPLTPQYSSTVKTAWIEIPIGEELVLQAQFTVQHTDLGWEARIPEFAIVEFGDTENECLAALEEAIHFRWREYANEPDHLHDEEAQEVAAHLRGSVQRRGDAAPG